MVDRSADPTIYRFQEALSVHEQHHVAVEIPDGEEAAYGRISLDGGRSQPAPFGLGVVVVDVGHDIGAGRPVQPRLGGDAAARGEKSDRAACVIGQDTIRR